MVKTEDGEYSDITFIEIFGYAFYSIFILGTFFLLGLFLAYIALADPQTTQSFIRFETLAVGGFFAASSVPGILLKVVWRANVSESVS